MTSEEVRKLFLSFFVQRGHKIIASSSLLPDDPTVLLTTAGMQQFKPYFLGQTNPLEDFGSKRVTSIQKCFRTSDIDEVGDKTHLTFFEMLGHFSFGDYFKQETIHWTFELLTTVFGINAGRISATVFEGDADVPFDQESFEIWNGLLPRNQISRGPRESNFWGPAGAEGPCGACNEVYVDGIEVATLVFMEYYSQINKELKPLVQKGVDVGWGFERLVALIQHKDNVFETDLFQPIYLCLPVNLTEQQKRILADHGRAITFLISDGVRPSNKEGGYILRRLLRRIIAYGTNSEEALFTSVVEKYHSFYPELNLSTVIDVFKEEKQKFSASLKKGLKELKKLTVIDAPAAFRLYESFGLPYEIIKEVGGEKAVNLRRQDFDKEYQKHQKISRSGAEKKFGGHGLLLDTGELKAVDEAEIKKVTRLHTVTHLLHQALREVLGEEVRQMGSDITAERTRFDFSFSRKLTSEEIARIEEVVNQKIKADLPVNFKEMPKEEAERTGALHFFKAKYPATVKVYFIGPNLESAYSKEFCGGPHVNRTSEIGRFKILKEEAVAAGVRRIRADVF